MDDPDKKVQAATLVKDIAKSLASLTELIPASEVHPLQERIQELEFQNSTLALRVQQLEAALNTVHTYKDSFAPSKQDKVRSDTDPVLSRSNSSVSRLRSDSCEQAPPGTVTPDGQVSSTAKEEMSPRKRDRKAAKSNNAEYILLMCSDENCEVMHPTDNIIRVDHMTRTHIRLMWKSEPKRALLIKKPNDESTLMALAQVARFLYNFECTLFVEDYVQSELDAEVAAIVNPLKREETVAAKPDFIVCLGGDGTILWASSIFTEGVPPLVSFSMGSLGFLTPFPFSEMEKTLHHILAGGMIVSLRSRILCEIYRSDGKLEQTHTVLNEVVVDRGQSSNLVHVHLYVGNRRKRITDVQGDGLIVSTPTGSTAYSLAAGGSMIHPAIPAMLVTPICPHSLSFRPFVVADATFLKMEIPKESRSSAWVSFDGRNRVELGRGDSVVVKVSQYPVPAVCDMGENDDWFSAIKSSFLWNERSVRKKRLRAVL